MEEKIKEIVSVFTKIPVDQIGPSTPIGRSAMQSSILLHRMYARLSEEGLVVDNYGNIRTFADLLQYRPGVVDVENRQTDLSGGSLPPDVPARRNFSVPAGVDTISAVGIGIDIEEVAALPITDDFRKEEFYKMNFTAAEIAYCILQPDPYASFTGLFAVKEAIIKSDGRYRNKIFNSVEISHSSEGKPEHPGYNLSISHAGKMAVAVAVPSGGGISGGVADLLQASPMPVRQIPAPGSKGALSLWLAMLALVLSAIAMILVLIHGQ
jgi:phosphopantetheine--protein transferase-like protein